MGNSINDKKHFFQYSTVTCFQKLKTPSLENHLSHLQKQSNLPVGKKKRKQSPVERLNHSRKNSLSQKIKTEKNHTINKVN